MKIKKIGTFFALIIKEKGIFESFESYDEAFKAGLSYFGGELSW